MQADILQSVAFTWVFKLYLTDHITPATGKTVAITLSKNTAAFGNPSVGASNATEIASGWYYFTSSTTDTGTLGPVIWLGTCTGCDNADQVYQVIKATNGGMTALPDTAVTTNASLITSGTSTAQLSVSSGAVLLQPTQSGVTIPTVTTVTNQLTAAQVATGVWQDATAGDFTTTSSIGKSLYTGGVVPGGTNGLFIAGTNAATTITTALTTTFTGNLTGNVGGSVGSVTGLTTATIATAIWTDTTAGDFTTLTSPGKIIFAQLGGTFTTTSSSVFSTAALANAGGSTPAAIATAVWQDTTAGDFTTSGSIGKSLFTSGVVPGAAGGLFIAGSNAATTVNITGNLTGNVSGSVGSVTAGVTVTTNSDKTGYTLTVTPPTAAAIATAVWTDTTGSDFTTSTSPGKIIFTQLGGAFTTTSSSIYSTAALANAPSGSGSSPAQIATAVWEDLLAGGDFATAGSIGLLLANQVPNLDVAVSSRSTYGGGDTTGTTTLLGLLTPTRAAYLDNLSGGAVALASGVTVTVNSDKTGYSLNLGQTLSAARDLTAIADTSLTLNDAFQAGAASTSGQEDVPGNLTYLTKTSAGTLLRTFTINSNTAPTFRH